MKYSRLPFLMVGVFFCLFFTPAPLLYAQNSPSSPENLQLSNLVIDDVFNKGVDCFLSHQFIQAEEFFRHCMNRKPDNAEYICWLAKTLAFNSAEQAMRGSSIFSLIPEGRTIRDLYKKAMEIDPHSERARIGYAVILRDIPGWLGGSVKKSEAMLREVLADNPQNLRAKHFLGTLYIKKRKKYKEGIEFLQQVLETAQTMTLSREEQFNLAYTYHAIGKTYLENLHQSQQAIPFLEKALSINPDLPVCQLNLAEAHFEEKQISQAKIELRKAAQYILSHKYKRFKKDLVKIARKLDMKKDLGL